MNDKDRTPDKRKRTAPLQEDQSVVLSCDAIASFKPAWRLWRAYFLTNRATVSM